MLSLTEQQTDAILSEALSHGYFELDVDGQLPRDADDRERAATELVRQCRLHYEAGSRADGITRLLHIAEDDLVNGTQPDTGGRMAATEVDLSQYPVDALKKFEETLMGYPPSDEVNQNLAQVRAEIARKTGTAVAATAPVVEVAQEQVSPQAVDAAAPEVHAAQDESIRNDLIDRLTFAQMRQHGIDPNQVTNLSTDQLQQIVGGAQEAAAPAPESEPVPPPVAPQPEPQGETIQTTVMVTSQPEPEPTPVAPAAPQETAPTSGVSAEREELEAQVTGPMLKSYGRGRVDVPEIGDNELRFMIENPEGRVTQEQLLAARALDQDAMEGTCQPEIAQETTSTAPSSEESVQAPVAVDNASPAEPSGPSKMTTSPVSSAPLGETSPAMTVTKEVLGPPQVDHFLPQRVTKAQAFSTDPPANPAQEIIDAEHLPTPPEIEGRPPRLPFDLSKCSDDEVRSYHAQFHACQSRANYIVGLWEGELRDIVKLRKGTEVQAANNAPKKDPDDSRKRLTDAQREALVAADPEVQAAKEREHEIERILRQLRTLRDGYASDVSTCSRQWAMRKEESNSAGGLH